ncbi:peroxisome membrane protein [Halteromyces radiatus]|uniref:peroxisome membrane protein n=1 Tax=Halteromyces radiatus TaxID=101107 RepID=UPI002220D5D9|nr:peroxisome membrane protein [Halteromyces radiatus]KAI8086573.1 peroxisome membrane protein [Halteromyces radiatus]
MSTMNILQIYEDVLIKNISQITTIEAALRSLSYILPGRFQDAELTSQTLYAGLNLIGLYHNSILRRAANDIIQQCKVTNIEESQFNKYTRFWNHQSGTHRMISRILSIIAYTQVLMEMGLLRKRSHKTHYQWIAILEAIKAILRLTFFRITNHRMILYPPHLERDIEPAKLDPGRHHELQVPTYHWTGRRTGKEVPFISSTIGETGSSFVDVNAYLMAKVLTPEKLRKPKQMVHVMSSLARFGEVAYILRPLIYVLGILVWGRRAWKPWFLSLVIDLMSIYAIQQSNGSDQHSNMMPLEKKEYHRRLKSLMFYILKGAFYSRITRPKLERLCNRLENKPLVNMVSGVLRDYLVLWENIYFYSSTS